MKIRPLQDWAVIRITGTEEKTAGGIIIPDAAKEKPSEGVVLAIGPGRYETEKGKEKEKKKTFVPTTVRPGQRIMFMKHRTEEFELDGEEITLVRERDILGTFDDKEVISGGKVPPVEPGYVKPVIMSELVVPVPAPVKDTGTINKSKASAVAEKKAGSKKTSPATTPNKEKEAKIVDRRASKPALAKSKTKASKGKTAVKKTAPVKKGRAQQTVSKKTTVKRNTGVSTAKKTASKKPIEKTTAKKKTVVKKTAPVKKGRVQQTVSKKTKVQNKTGSSLAKKKVVKKLVKKTTEKKKVSVKKTVSKTPRRGKR